MTRTLNFRVRLETLRTSVQVACKFGFVLIRPKKKVSTDHLSHFWRLTPWLVCHPVYLLYYCTVNCEISFQA
jgi:hypothetical protein